MATYCDNNRCIYFSLIRDDQGWTVTLPGWWKIDQVERYLKELELV